MISIPVSFLLAMFFLALGLSMFFWRALPRLSRQLFLLMFSLMALEAALVGARFAFCYSDLLVVQRMLPVWIAPAVYLSFVSLTAPANEIRRRLVLNTFIALVFSLAMFIPIPFNGYIDSLIAGSFTVYAAALFRLWRLGPDQFSQAPTRLGEVLLKLLGFAVAMILATLLIDVFVAFLFAQEMDATAAVTISIVSLLFLIVATGLLVEALRTQSRRQRGAEKVCNEESASRAELVETARKVLIEKGLYKDPGMTLTRLARRVGVPDRDLSHAINQCTGENVSQFVNLVRLKEAARLLSSTQEPIARIQEQVGFLTRSNFYREFQKVYGEAPAAFRKKLRVPNPNFRPPAHSDK
jgi:AraC-like DNA-binding protein